MHLKQIVRELLRQTVTQKLKKLPRKSQTNSINMLLFWAQIAYDVF